MNFDHRAARQGSAPLMSDELCYLATPYTNYRGGIEQAAADAARLAARLLCLGFTVYSPIAHSHLLAVKGGLDPRNYQIWRPHNIKMMEKSDLLIVGKLDGWDQSTGVRDEIDYFDSIGRDIIEIEPESCFIKRYNGVH